MEINGKRLQCKDDRTNNDYFYSHTSWKALIGITDNMGKYQYW